MTRLSWCGMGVLFCIVIMVNTTEEPPTVPIKFPGNQVPEGKPNPNTDSHSNKPDEFPEENEKDSNNTGQACGKDPNGEVNCDNDTEILNGKKNGKTILQNKEIENKSVQNKGNGTELKHIHHNQVHHSEKVTKQQKAQQQKLQDSNKNKQKPTLDASQSRPAKKDNAPTKEGETKDNSTLKVSATEKVPAKENLLKNKKVKEIQLEDIHIIQKQPKKNEKDIKNKDLKNKAIKNKGLKLKGVNKEKKMDDQKAKEEVPYEPMIKKEKDQ